MYKVMGKGPHPYPLALTRVSAKSHCNLYPCPGKVRDRVRELPFIRITFTPYTLTFTLKWSKAPPAVIWLAVLLLLLCRGYAQLHTCGRSGVQLYFWVISLRVRKSRAKLMWNSDTFQEQRTKMEIEAGYLGSWRRQMVKVSLYYE